MFFYLHIPIFTILSMISAFTQSPVINQRGALHCFGSKFWMYLNRIRSVFLMAWSERWQHTCPRTDWAVWLPNHGASAEIPRVVSYKSNYQSFQHLGSARSLRTLFESFLIMRSKSKAKLLSFPSSTVSSLSWYGWWLFSSIPSFGGSWKERVRGRDKWRIYI